MNRIFLLFLVSILTFGGCFDSEIPQLTYLGSDALQDLVFSAINGDKKANDSLSNLIDFENADKSSYNLLSVDSFNLDNLNYYSVLIEYPNSIYNRFAIYDSTANCYLIDKSLNGKLSLEEINVNDLRFLKIIERFFTKDALPLVRVSLYMKSGDSINLVYRSFAEVRTSKSLFSQTIYSISSDTIKTKLRIPNKNKIETKEDFYVFNPLKKSYQSNQSLFDSLVYKEINKNSKTVK